MNIKRAKQEIKDTIEAYLKKDEEGEYRIPAIRQRPILLLGAPGIGKTQIMEQIARECRIGLVAYTITHHTRQSAIGLPFIARKEFAGREYSVTEYTMSEIVAAVYEKQKQTGLSEGILFLDEINCVSETLAPAMLQFLQCKTFGTHAIPEGWIIVAAGNPPEFNKSVREFDVVTLDRVKKILVEPDFSIWKEYAQRQQIHSAVTSYLTARPSFFYRMETTIDGKQFATPRGWEDLSRLLEVYEELNKRADRDVIIQYIQHEKIARDFANYLELYEKYQFDYQLDAILRGEIDDLVCKKAAHASFDERLGVVSLLLSRCNHAFAQAMRKEQEIELIYSQLGQLRQALTGVYRDRPETFLQDVLSGFTAQFEKNRQAEILTREEIRIYKNAIRLLEELQQKQRLEGVTDGEEAMEYVSVWFDRQQNHLDEMVQEGGDLLEHSFDFLEAAYGSGQEMVIFITELNSNYYSIQFLKEYDCERYFQYNESLLIDERSRDIESRLREIQI